VIDEFTLYVLLTLPLFEAVKKLGCFSTINTSKKSHFIEHPAMAEVPYQPSGRLWNEEKPG